MITAESFKKAGAALQEAKRDTESWMPKAKLVFIGADNDYLFFNVVAKASSITEQQVRNLKEKTRFQTICVKSNGLLYQAEFKMNLWPPTLGKAKTAHMAEVFEV